MTAQDELESVAFHSRCQAEQLKDVAHPLGSTSPANPMEVEVELEGQWLSIEPFDVNTEPESAAGMVIQTGQDI